MRVQSRYEERLNAITHGFGVLFGVIALILMLLFYDTDEQWALFSVLVYGFSIIMLFLSSTIYHSMVREQLKYYFRILDHISIYFLIAGTYTPVLLLLLPDSRGYLLFWIVWGIAIFGSILKLFFTGRFELFSTLLYLVMGWLIVFDYTALAERIHPTGLLLLFSGGLFYTVGIVFYAIDKIPFNHVIWHLFVLAGAISHFLMIWLYIL